MIGAARASSRSIALVLFALIVPLAIAWAGRVSEGQKALTDSDAALARGDTAEAILSARIAAEARCPGCSAPDLGFAKLEKIARDAEARGDDTTAFGAWCAARAAILASSVLSTSSARRAHADLEVARFAHRLDSAAVAAGAPPTPAAAEEKVRAALAQSDVPGGAAFALVGIGGIVFLAFGVRFARGGAKRRSDLGLAAAGAVLAAAGALLF